MKDLKARIHFAVNKQTNKQTNKQKKKKKKKLEFTSVMLRLRLVLASKVNFFFTI